MCGGGGSLLKDVEQTPSVNCTTQSKQHRQTALLTPLAFRFGMRQMDYGHHSNQQPRLHSSKADTPYLESKGARVLQ